MFQMKFGITFPAFVLFILFVSCENDSPAPQMQGKGGSLARFALANGHLYVVDQTSVNVFQIQPNGGLEKINTVEAGFGIETIFAREENLFLGANDGMFIYSIADPSAPEFLSKYEHIISCDPVVVQGQYAYVTLRVSGCRTSGFDALEIIDIKNLHSPVLVRSYETESPYGLGVDGNLLFLCQGDRGLKIYDITQPQNVSVLRQYSDMHAYDVIPDKGVLLLTGNNGIFQYDYSDINNIRVLSHIPIHP
jgi:hypothetical protein